MKEVVFASPQRPFDLLLNMAIAVIAVVMVLPDARNYLGYHCFLCSILCYGICARLCIIPGAHGFTVAVLYTAES